MSIIIVTSSADTAVKGELTLRQAVAEARSGDTIEFAKTVTAPVDLTKTLVISKSITIDGSRGAFSQLNGNEQIYADDASVEIVDAHVTLVDLGVGGGFYSHKRPKNGPNGDNALPGQNGEPATDGGLGGNGGASMSNGADGAGALVNKGTLTLDHVGVSGSTGGVFGGSGGSGGAGGKGGNDTSGADPGGHGGSGGRGGNGANGGETVGGILNEGTLVMRDSEVVDCLGVGGMGGAGGEGGAGANGGTGIPGGNGGNGGSGGKGGVGGIGVGGILNEGKITFEGSNLFYDNSGVGGAAGVGGAGGAAGQGGRASDGGTDNGRPGTAGGKGQSGAKGTGYDNIRNLGSITGSYGARDFFEFAGPRYAGAHTIGIDTAELFNGFAATELMEGKDTVTGSVHWKVVGVGGDLQKSDFVNGIMSGKVSFAAGQDIGGLDFSFVSAFTPTKRETFDIELYSPSGGDGLGENDILTETLIPVAKGNQTINGTNGDDDIACGPGNDVVNGMGGSDNIYCGSGRDTINCDSGDDEVTAGTGVDTLVAGSGRDAFTFFLDDSKPSAPDTIEGFNHALGDTISIAGASEFIGSKGFDGLANEIRAVENSTINETIVSYATTGEKTASIEIVVKGLHSFVAGDFGLP